MLRLASFALLQSFALSAALPSSGSLADSSPVPHVKRASIAPIAVSAPDQIAGGQIANDGPPVASFLDGLKPPVRQTLTNDKRNR